MKNVDKSKIVPNSKELLSLIATAADIKETAKILNVDTKKVYNVLNNSNKRDMLIVMKAMKKCVQKRIKKEQKIIDKVTFVNN